METQTTQGVTIFDVELAELANRMVSPTSGVEVKDRTYYGKTYEKCFIGSEAITWLCQEKNIPRDKALELGRQLEQLGLFSHCVFDHQLKDEYLFYRFTGTATDSAPPGSFGAPLVGETLSLQGDVPGFFVERGRKYQGFFKTNLLFNKCVVFGDASSMSVFHDESVVVRESAMPPHWIDIFAGGNPKNATVNMLDGTAHRQRKAALMNCFSPAAIQSYLPVLQNAIGVHLNKWIIDGATQLKWVPALKMLCFDQCSNFILGVSPSPELAKTFDDIMSAFAALPIKLPGSTLSTGIAAKDKILDIIKKSLIQNRTNPPEQKNALFYLLQHAADDATLTDDIICYEILHFMIAGMAPVYTLHVYLLLELSQNPEARDKVRKEIQSLPKAAEIKFEDLGKLEFTSLVIKEVQRLHAGNAVPFSWGKVATDFSHQGFNVPKGWGGVGAFHACSHSSRVYTNPEVFDPMRFASPHLEHTRHEYAFVPQGSPNVLTTHGCAGYDMTSVMLKVFLINLLQSYDWELLPKQKLAKNPAGVPALPIDGLKVRFFQLKM